MRLLRAQRTDGQIDSEHRLMSGCPDTFDLLSFLHSSIELYAANVITFTS